MKTISINTQKLSELLAQTMDGHIVYGFGSKAALSALPATITKIDCSGYVRYLIYNITNGTVTMPDGSWIQHEWCDKQKFHKTPYSTAAERDGWLRIAFLPPVGGHAGHVWLILN